MFAQYFGMKDAHPEAILLARIGDFYEAYGADAEIVARALQIALTSKDGGNGQRIAMAGVPHHALEGYLAKLVAQRFVVALAEQLEAPQPNKLVKRAVTRVVTPGTLVEERLLGSARNNYLAAVAGHGELYAFVYADLSTGEAAATVTTGPAALDDLKSELHRVAPVEILAPASLRAPLEDLAAALPARLVDAPESNPSDERHFEGFSRAESAMIARVCERLQHYVRSVGFDHATPLREVRTYSRETFVTLDAATRRHLELLRALGANAKATLFATVDKTRTAMGARLLARWILAPLLEQAAIDRRADAVQALLEDYAARATLAERLDPLYDLERIAQKVRLRRVLPRDLASLRRTLAGVAPLRDALQQSLPRLAARIPDFAALQEELQNALLDEPAANLSDGGVMRASADEELATCLELRTNGHERLTALEERERSRSGIKGLKIKYASAFGYGIEVPRSQSEKVPPDWVRRQTLANAERFTTPELKELEAAIASAATRAIRLEESLYKALVERVALDVEALLETADAIAEVDVYVSFAQIAAERGYVRPQFVADSRIEILDGRHPVIEVLRGASFVPNDLRLHVERERFLLITGPNMGGKSTYLRQTALLTLMAQIGSFVPARSMRTGIVDRIFTRIGAGDDLASGQSTFYLEMAETAHILHRCTRRSLLLIDEVGRGTGTSDGLAIAQAICEYLIGLTEAAPMVLFATHFHELVALAETSKLVANYHVTAVEQLGASGEPVFSHRVLPGSTSRSFGIEVAKMAGLPAWVIARAQQIAAELLTQNSTVHAISELPADALDPVEQRNHERRSVGKPKASAAEIDFSTAPRQLALDW